MYLVLWEYLVPAAQRPGFERAYGPSGDWVKLFERGEGYLGTELYRDENMPGRYITLDRWASSEAYGRFKHEFKTEYESLDAACTALSDHESRLGSFSSL